MDIEQDLTKAGVKITEARKSILAFLRKNVPGHFSAEDIHKNLAKNDFGIATIYRTLIQLESVGLIIRHSFVDGLAVYEANHDEHHDHAVCLACGKVYEFHDEEIEQKQNTIAQQLGLKPIRHTHVIYGYCQNRCSE